MSENIVLKESPKGISPEEEKYIHFLREFAALSNKCNIICKKYREDPQGEKLSILIDVTKKAIDDLVSFKKRTLLLILQLKKPKYTEPLDNIIKFSKVSIEDFKRRLSGKRGK